MTNYGTMGGASQDPAERMKDEAQMRAGEALDQAKQKAGETVEQAKQTTRAMMDQQKGRAAEGLGSMASALRQTGEQLRNQDQATFGQYAEQVANKFDAIAGQIRDKDMDEILYEVENFARREPEIFLGGAVLLGLLGARFLKSSNARRQTMRYPQGRPYTTYGYGTGAGTRAGSYPATSYRTGVTGEYAGEAYRQGRGSFERESEYSGEGTETFERGTSGTYEETARGYGQRSSGTYDEERGFVQGSQGQERTDYAPGETNPAGRSGRGMDPLDEENESPIR